MRSVMLKVGKNHISVKGTKLVHPLRISVCCALPTISASPQTLKRKRNNERCSCEMGSQYLDIPAV